MAAVGDGLLAPDLSATAFGYSLLATGCRPLAVGHWLFCQQDSAVMHPTPSAVGHGSPPPGYTGYIPNVVDVYGVTYASPLLVPILLAAAQCKCADKPPWPPPSSDFSKVYQLMAA